MMTTVGVELKIDGERAAECLQDACEEIGNFQGEMVLDFSSVRRIDTKAVRALEELASLAQGKGLTIALRGANVEIYKVLKLMKLAAKFRFLR